ncbi:hypothetical protein QCD79_31455, partial [Pseudomonas quasicaspiana]|nr:hypothetical protein [Pseudomonas quasicaspiana]
WLVVGSGQSASESVLELIARERDILLHSVHRSAGFKLPELGQFETCRTMDRMQKDVALTGDQLQYRLTGALPGADYQP